ncbi:MAG TPA: hypothetical protein VF707_17795, partial [Ardenticatenaceae bacterium]
MTIALSSEGGGVIGTPGDEDYYLLNASGESWLEIDIFAYRADSALDSELVLLDGRGQIVARNDDFNGIDSYLRLRLPGAGAYYIVVGDLSGDEGGTEYHYQL